MRKLASILVTALAINPIATAQQYEVMQANTTITIPVDSGSNNEIYLIFREPNKQKQNFQINLRGPSGLNVSINSTSAPATQDSLVTALGSFVYPTKIFVNNTSTFNHKIGGGSGNTSGSRDINCGCLTEAEINNYLDLFRQFGQPTTRQNFCQQLGTFPGSSCESSPDSGNNPDAEIILQSFISRNQCSNLHHLAIVKLDLSEVDKSTAEPITLTAKFKSFLGKKASSIKERGDGKYPQPLLLASPISGGYFGSTDHSIRLSRWQSERRLNTTQISVGDMVYYGPVGALLRIPLTTSSHLNGGKGTFEVSKNGRGYSMCAKLVAKRQYFYGYTN
jgi:hypothetical protein